MLAPNAVPHLMTATKAGPRHLAFAPDGAHAYLLNETDYTMTALAFDAQLGRLTPLGTVSTLAAPKAGNTGAEVIATGAFVYGSNRGDNSIVTMTVAGNGTVTPTAWTPTAGMTPRSFAIRGDAMLVANQGSGTITPMKLAAGVPAMSAPTIAFPGPEFVAIVALP